MDKEFTGETAQKESWFTAFFENDTLMRNLRTGLILIVSIGAAFVYFGIGDQLSLATILSVAPKIGFLSILTLLSVQSMRYDTATRAFEDEMSSNTGLIETNTKIETERSKIKNHDLGIDFASDYNQSRQKTLNKAKTKTELDRMERLLIELKVAGKSQTKKYSYVQSRIEYLQKNQLVDKRFKPVSFSTIYQTEHGTKKKEDHDLNKELNFNPKTHGMTKSVFSSVIKSLGIGGSGSFVFALSESWESIVIYYGLLLASLTLTAVTTYPKTRKLTGKRYLNVRKEVLNLLTQCNVYIFNKEAEFKQKAIADELRAAEEKKQADSKQLDDIQSAFPGLPRLPMGKLITTRQAQPS